MSVKVNRRNRTSTPVLWMIEFKKRDNRFKVWDWYGGEAFSERDMCIGHIYELNNYDKENQYRAAKYRRVGT